MAAPVMSIEKWLVLQVNLDKVRRAVAELPERQRAVVQMHKFEELDCQHIGQALGCSGQAVRSLLCRAYTTLRERLADVA
jgi:RNA polymerase sigma factor (sigma-70 family)